MSGGGDGDLRRPPPSLRHHILLALALLLASTATVPVADLAFALLSVPYLYFLSAVSFPPARAEPPVFTRANRLHSAYFLLTAVVGLLLPAAYLLDRALAGDRSAVEAAAPHLFLLCVQVFLEGFTFWRRFSMPMFALVSVIYNAKRLSSLVGWVERELEVEGGRVLAGRGLAVLSLGLWCFNLFGFLLPVFLPSVLKRYYGGNDRIGEKSSSKDE